MNICVMKTVKAQDKKVEPTINPRSIPSPQFPSQFPTPQSSPTYSLGLEPVYIKGFSCTNP